MRCDHEFFKPGSLKCARCGEPMSRLHRHVRVGAPDSESERWIADREPVEVASHAPIDPLWALAAAEMVAADEAARRNGRAA